MQKEKTSDNRIVELQSQNEQLRIENYMQSLQDDKTFRAYLIQEIKNLTQEIENLRETVVEISSQGSEEDEEVEEQQEE